MSRPATAVQRASRPSSKSSQAIQRLLSVQLREAVHCSECASDHHFQSACACLCSKEMNADDLHRRVEGRLPETLEADGRRATHEVLAAIAQRLSPDEAAELGAELPDELGDLLA